jgi:hypothetical protein
MLQGHLQWVAVSSQIIINNPCEGFIQNLSQFGNHSHAKQYPLPIVGVIPYS